MFLSSIEVKPTSLYYLYTSHKAHIRLMQKQSQLRVQSIYKGGAMSARARLKTLTIKVKNPQNRHKQKDKVLSIAKN